MANRATRFRTAGLMVISAAFVISTAALAEPIKTEAVITKVEGNTITAKTMNGPLTVVLSPSTDIAQTSGLASKKGRDAKHLIPGLIFTVDGDLQGQTLTAEHIRFKEKDWRTAVATKAGVEETSRRSEELRTAYSKMGDWDIRAEENVFFKTGSAVIASSDKERLLALAQKAASHKGYVISVLGFADPRGNAAANEKLSNRRAQAVINYLKQSGKVLPGRVLGASAMGEMHIPVEKPSPSELQGARKVTVRVLTSAAQLNQ